MTELTETEVCDFNEKGKMKLITASVTAVDNTIVISDMTTIKDVRATVSGTPGTLKACTFTGNTITTTGWSSGTESWILVVWGV